MISKPLFKQSCKANVTIWAFVTSITCAMLAIIIIVLGNLNVSSIRDSMVDMFVEDAIESSVDKQSMTYFNMTENALINYDDNCEKLGYLLNVQMGTSRELITSNYNELKSQGLTSEQAKETITSQISDEQEKIATLTLLNYYEKQGNDYSQTKISEYVLLEIQDNIYSELIESEGQEIADNAKRFISQAISGYIAQKGQSGYDATKFATSYIPAVLKDIFIEQSFEYQNDTISIRDYFTIKEIEETSSSAILSFRAQSDIKKQQIIEQINAENPTLSESEKQKLVMLRLAEYRLNYIEESSGKSSKRPPEDSSI